MVKRAYVTLNKRTYEATYDATRDLWVVEATAPDVGSQSQPGGVYQMEIHAEDAAGNHSKMDSSDATYGNLLKIQVNEKPSPNYQPEETGVATELLVLDRQFNTLAVIDIYESLIWSERYQEAGDIELVVPATVEMLEYLRIDRYLIMSMSEKAMVIEEITLESDIEYGNRMVVKGRSLECLLERRVVWFRVDGSDDKTTVNFQDGMERILNENCIQPEDSRRIIPGLKFKRSEDPRVMALKLAEDHWGDNVYELFCNQCKYYHLGWKLTPTYEGELIVEFYFGDDRSWNQDKNPWVVFSPAYDNFLKSNYFLSKKGYITAVLGVGPKEQYYDETTGPNIVASVFRNDDGGSGLERRELAVDCTEFTSYVAPEEGDDFPDDQDVKKSILRQITTKITQTLDETGTTELFEGEAEITRQFVYGEDFFMGDIVQLQNGYGMEAPARVDEVMLSFDTTGFTCVPTFTGMSDEISQNS